jgi:hypothetical protein
MPAASIDADSKPLQAGARRSLAEVLPGENWEGIEIIEEGHNANVWFVSDDNFQWPQHTLLAKLSLADVVKLMSAR